MTRNKKNLMYEESYERFIALECKRNTLFQKTNNRINARQLFFIERGIILESYLIAIVSVL